MHLFISLFIIYYATISLAIEMVMITANQSAVGAQQIDPNLFVTEVENLGINSTELLLNGEAWFNYTFGIDLSTVPANWASPIWKFTPQVIVFLLQSNYQNLYNQRIQTEAV